jgi:CheY-like chemotaxis protein
MFGAVGWQFLNDPAQSVPADLAQQRPVLVVDDEQDIRHVLRDLLTDEGYQVLLARDGDEGLRLLASADQPLVVLLDLMMPRVDGFEVCRRLAADPHLRDDHAVVLMSARRNLAAADQTAIAASLAKPFEIDELLALVARLARPPTP